MNQVRENRIWRSIFRSGSGDSNLRRSLFVQQNVFLHLFSIKARKRVLEFSATWYLGALTFGTFLILVITGILLMLYYHPSVPQAYADMKDLQYVVSSGVFLRNLHRWSAHAMVFLVFAHMFKVFYRGAYRTPREFNWIIGVVLLLVTLLLSYTGYLLPWDQLAYWAVTVGSNIASAVPLMGAKIRFLMLGGTAVNANALLRFYVLHCVILPVTRSPLHRRALLADPQRRRNLSRRIGFGGEQQMSDPKDFVAVVDSDARKTPRRIAFITKRSSPQVHVKDEDRVMTYPEVFFRAAVAIEVMAVALVVVALLWDAPLEGLADPMHTPNPAKAPWYFLGLQEMLHYFPPVVAGVLVPGLVVMALIVIPYFKINVEAEGLWLRDKAKRLRIFGIVVVLFCIFLAVFDVWVALVPTLIVAGFMLLAAQTDPQTAQGFRRWLVRKPLSFWVMTWFLFELVVLTAIGTFFRGPGWSWVLPWRA